MQVKKHQLEVDLRQQPKQPHLSLPHFSTFLLLLFNPIYSSPASGYSALSGLFTQLVELAVNEYQSGCI